MPLNRPPLSEAEIVALAGLDRPGGRRNGRRASGRAARGVALGLPPAPTAGAARGPHERLGAESNRPLHPGAPRESRSSPSPEAEPHDPAAPREPRPHRLAPVPRGNRRRSWRIDPPIVTYATVDRLLASPHFGERWARPWLDQARYADSNGYSIDAPRSIWKYRDWVITAFNGDLPFDRFLIDQIAGDLHPATHAGPADRDGIPPEYADQPGGRHRRRAVPRSSRSSIGSTRRARSSSA